MHTKKTILLWGVFLLSNYFISAQVGIGTLDPKSTLDVNGNLSVKVLTLNGGSSSNQTPINDGVYISLNPTTGNQQFFIVEPSTVPGRIYFIRNISNTVSASIFTTGNKRFFPKNATTGTEANGPLVLNANSSRQSVYLISDGVNWTYFE
jgi:hypothetical protein